jgi:hypothetical protein
VREVGASLAAFAWAMLKRAVLWGPFGIFQFVDFYNDHKPEEAPPIEVAVDLTPTFVLGLLVAAFWSYHEVRLRSQPPTQTHIHSWDDKSLAAMNQMSLWTNIAGSTPPTKTEANTPAEDDPTQDAQ